MCFNAFIYAQRLEWSNSQKIRGNSIYTKVLGQNENGIFILRHRNTLLSKFVTLEKYRHNLGFDFSKSFVFKKERILDAQLLNNKICISKLSYNKKEDNYNVNAIFLNLQFENTNVFKKIATIETDLFLNEIEIFTKWSANKKIFALSYLNKIGKNETQIIIKSFNNEIDTLHNYEYKLNYDFDDIKIHSMEIKTNGYILVLLELIKKKDKQTHAYQVVVCKNAEQFSIPLNDSLYQIYEPKLVQSNYSNEAMISGYAINNKDQKITGHQHWKIKCDSILKINYKFTPYQDSFVKKTIGYNKHANNQLDMDYELLGINYLSNNSFVKCSERINKIKQEDYIIINGIPQNQTKSYITYGEIMVEFFDSLGNFSKGFLIPKNQTSQPDGLYFSSASVFATPYFLYIIFNENLKIDSDIIQYQIDRNGKNENKVLINGFEFNTWIMPDEASQISSTEMLFPVLKERKFALLKLIF